MQMMGDIMIGIGMYLTNIDDKKMLDFVQEYAAFLHLKENVNFDFLSKLDDFASYDASDEDVYNAAKPLFDVSYCDNLREMMYETLASIMNSMTGIGFEYRGLNHDDVIMLANALPWNFNDKEKKLTESELIALLDKKKKKLGVPKTDIGEIYAE